MANLEFDIPKAIELGAKMNAQDNRSTQFPLFVVQHKVRVYVGSDQAWDETERKEDAHKNDLCFDCRQIEQELPDDCENCYPAAFLYIRIEKQFDLRAGVFFTAEACDAHIETNIYHYGEEPRSFAISAWRNPEMESIMSWLSALGSMDEKPVSFYR